MQSAHRHDLYEYIPSLLVHFIWARPVARGRRWARCLVGVAVLVLMSCLEMWVCVHSLSLATNSYRKLHELFTRCLEVCRAAGYAGVAVGDRLGLFSFPDCCSPSPCGRRLHSLIRWPLLPHPQHWKSRRGAVTTLAGVETASCLPPSYALTALCTAWNTPLP
ncbi:hypothetical protein SKAU_G00239640 [Synaphobranchus kaupii]|uniref:Uncharacterized protein n=1 Tax=Synaphobranchus kaupii TaxID=118154 RepID=A0A9Q1F7E8_SYNKA|nr:hypothetical protein SKAU_G00239640 [Synaphobranchus kaupii]